jgi:23S rRNA (uracil747-C5)-methyltransferase
VLELYCGQGAFSFHLARAATEVLGMDSRDEAVQSANKTARAAGMSHVQFQRHDATQVEHEAEKFGADLILVNPPRAGLRDGVQVIARAKPAHFFYSSCSIETLARDLERLSSQYEIKRARIFDMFPHTEHFETLLWLTRKSD